MNLDEAIKSDADRCARLTLQLPKDSRLVEKMSPTKDWNWDREMQSRILAKLDELSCILLNMFRNKNKKAIKPQDQFQPDYVKEAKKEAKKLRGEQKKAIRKEIDKMEEFWKKRNPDVKFFPRDKEIDNG